MFDRLAPDALIQSGGFTTRSSHAVKFLLCVALLAASLPAPAEDPPPNWVSDARISAQALGGQLKHQLMNAVEQDGLIAAIDICQLQAPAIAAEVSTPSIKVGRTALRIRNPGNAADAWERMTLENFERRITQGEDPDHLEAFVVRLDDGQRSGHWMKAIPTDGLCLSCHGSELDNELKQTIDQRYPQDQATGFAFGSLRGAFSVQIDLPDPD